MSDDTPLSALTVGDLRRVLQQELEAHDQRMAKEARELADAELAAAIEEVGETSFTLETRR